MRTICRPGRLAQGDEHLLQVALHLVHLPSSVCLFVFLSPRACASPPILHWRFASLQGQHSELIITLFTFHAGTCRLWPH